MKETNRVRSGLKAVLSASAVHDLLVTSGVLSCITLAAELLNRATASVINTSFIYMLAIVIISRYTDRYIYGILGSGISTLCINYFFTYPYGRLNFTLSGYPFAFLAMLLISILTSTATSSLKEKSRIISAHEKQLAAAEKEKMKANLLRAISHDLRTPLTGIIGSADLYLSEGLSLSDADGTALVHNIQDEASWLLGMVENILTVTKLNADHARITKTQEPVEEVLSEAVLKVKKRFPDAQIQVRIPDEILMVPMDAILIEQVIINLLENAVVHSESPQPIECYITAEPDKVTFHVRDFGIGISSDRMKHILEGTGLSPGENSDSHRGMGIGLSLCRTIISAHQGQFSVQSGREHPIPFPCRTKFTSELPGTEFCFSLPLGNSPAPESEEQK